MERTLILCWFLILCILETYGGNYSKIESRVSNLRKVTNLRFFFHGILGGENTTAVTVARANSSFLGPSNSIVVDHAPLTVGPEPTSKNIGNAQGLKVFSSRDTTTVVVYLDFGFTKGELNDNSISVFSWNLATETERELVVIEGRGKFKLPEGYALLKTIFISNTSLVVD